MLGGIGLPELIVIFVVVLLLFGAKALPEVAKGLAQAIKTFKREAKSITDEVSLDDSDSNKERRDWRPPNPPDQPTSKET